MSATKGGKQNDNTEDNLYGELDMWYWILLINTGFSNLYLSKGKTKTETANGHTAQGIDTYTCMSST